MHRITHRDHPHRRNQQDKGEQVEEKLFKSHERTCFFDSGKGSRLTISRISGPVGSDLRLAAVTVGKQFFLGHDLLAALLEMIIEDPVSRRWNRRDRLFGRIHRRCI